ncbi:hypothetical protein [Koleobacter methoxysyntrophicus]|uniref:hypothetical protein n=1 Tax=Koleobacter methoxysyntrophicus TaxID=2751313 RepID=UPI0019D62914|nr:hypothetical protein [Koleobacter methoxysyntrophicus]
MSVKTAEKIWVSPDGSRLLFAFRSSKTSLKPRYYFAAVWGDEKEVFLEHLCPARKKCWHIDYAVDFFVRWAGLKKNPGLLRVVKRIPWSGRSERWRCIIGCQATDT